MPNYRRAVAPGGTFFFTIVTFQRRRIFSDPICIDHLRQAMRNEQTQNPFAVEAAVVLPDHLHLIWRLPEGDSAYSARIGRIKAGFTKAATEQLSSGPVNFRLQKGYSAIWQPRFWEHLIRDEEDFERHLNYIHYNPVKHGFARCPHEWPYSSFSKWVRNHTYRGDWCCSCHGSNLDVPDFSGINPECE